MGKIITDQSLTMENMLDEDQAQTMRLQASIDAVNRRLLQTYNEEEGLKHTINNLYKMIENLQNRFNALLQISNVTEEQLEEVMQINQHNEL